MPRFLRRLLFRLGHRGAALTTVAVTFLAYGTGLVSGYEPTFAVAYRYPIGDFGWVFIGMAAFMVTGIFLHRDAVHYATAELGMTAWAILLATHWTQPFGWTAAVSWWGLALGLFVVSAWPEVPRRRHEVTVPPLPTFEELVGPAGRPAEGGQRDPG